METSRLIQLLRSLQVAPSNDTELSATAEAISEGFGGVAVALHWGQSLRLAGVGHLDSSRTEELRGVLQNRIQIENEFYSGMSIEGFSGLKLTIAAIEGEIQPLAPRRAAKPRKRFGAIALEEKSPGAQDAALIAVSRRLAELAELADYETALRTRNQFLSIASHELKTPLTSIYGMLQLQERQLNKSAQREGSESESESESESAQERQRLYLRKVIRQVERLNELIDDLLDVSRIQNGRFVVEPTDTDVAVALREAISTRLDLIAAEQGVEINLEAPDQLSAWIDPVRLEEVVTNLVMNAIRFSPEGGVVWVKLRTDGDAFRLVVRDQGPSLAIEDRERIFQPFERAQRTSRLGGLGLGLFISRQIAQLHGGNVSLVESVPGKGNVFEAHFPLRSLGLISA